MSWPCKRLLELCYEREERRNLGLQFGAAVGLVLVPNQFEGKTGHGLSCSDLIWIENRDFVRLKWACKMDENGPTKMGLNRVMGLRPNNKRKTKIIIKIKRIIKDDKQKN